MSTADSQNKDIHEAVIKEIQKLLTAREIDPVMPESLAPIKGFEELFETMLEIRLAIMAFAAGNLSCKIKKKGYVPGAVKALQASLNHLTWQTQMIASGDFTQRVDFMGKFSESFNIMVKKLDESMQKLTVANEQLRDLNLKLELMAHTDPLTGINNRGYFMELLELEVERARRYGSVFSLLALDLDHFKTVNDTYGHAAGDEALRTFVRVVQKSGLRKNDIFGRIGGEEFAISLAETDRRGAAEVAERLRANLAATAVTHAGRDFFITTSIGVNEYQPGDTKETLLQRADQAMYNAKKSGRNKVCLFCLLDSES